LKKFSLYTMLKVAFYIEQQLYAMLKEVPTMK
jgi:hypothetical protein